MRSTNNIYNIGNADILKKNSIFPENIPIKRAA